MEQREVLNELIENLYFSMNTSNPEKSRLTVYDKSKLARAYKIAEELYEYDLVDKNEVEDFVNKITEVTT